MLGLARPGPERLPVSAVEGSDAENSGCPYSGKHLTDVLKLYSRRFGFFNALCRDKTVADLKAWSKCVDLYHS